MHAIRFAALGDATRFRLVEMLSEKPLPVHVLTSAFAISRPAISRHLRVLKEAGVVIEEKQGRENLYKLQAQHLVPLSQWLSSLDLPAAAPAKKAAPSPKPARVRRVAKPKALVAIPEIRTPEPARKAKSAAPAQNQMAWEF